MEMLKMVWLFHLFYFSLLGLTVAGQESIKYLNLYDTTPEVFPALSRGGLPVAVPVRSKDLGDVSTSILKAESWLRAHVLAQFPATKISTILVGEPLLCHDSQERNLGLLLPSLKSIYHSLKRWGLEKDIKVSAVFSLQCFQANHDFHGDHLVEKVLKPLLEFLRAINSTYSIHSLPSFSPLTHENLSLISAHRHFMKKIGGFELGTINVIVPSFKESSRKLSAVESKYVDPFPARPSPLPEISPTSFHSSIGFSMPANVAKPPQSHTSSQPPPSFPLGSPPPLSFPTPEGPPVFVPASPPFGFSLPPCGPSVGTAPAPDIVAVQKLWCVAKPSVPEETLQEAMDYACGEGDADCEEIQPHGSCFYPDTIVAHASYAFNSYWQKSKKNGGTCDFGGTAMVINADPSFLECRFVLS